jgi:hypothetical protein
VQVQVLPLNGSVVFDHAAPSNSPNFVSVTPSSVITFLQSGTYMFQWNITVQIDWTVPPGPTGVSNNFGPYDFALYRNNTIPISGSDFSAGVGATAGRQQIIGFATSQINAGDTVQLENNTINQSGSTVVLTYLPPTFATYAALQIIKLG